MPDIAVVVRRIVDEEDAQKGYCCIAGRINPWNSALCVCTDWIAANLGKHIEGYHLATGDGVIIGHLYYARSQHALVPYRIEPGATVIYCEWVKQKYQGRGLGKHLFTTFLGEEKKNKSKGIVVITGDAVGNVSPQTYLDRGFAITHREETQQLLYLPVSQESIEIQAFEPQLNVGRKTPVEIHVIRGFMCPQEIATQLILEDVVKEFGDQAILKEVMLSPESLLKYGTASGIFINGKQKLGGGEMEEAVRQAIAEELR